jgi:hypothetical protein
MPLFANPVRNLGNDLFQAAYFLVIKHNKVSNGTNLRIAIIANCL